MHLTFETHHVLQVGITRAGIPRRRTRPRRRRSLTHGRENRRRTPSLLFPTLPLRHARSARMLALPRLHAGRSALVASASSVRIIRIAAAAHAHHGRSARILVKHGMHAPARMRAWRRTLVQALGSAGMMYRGASRIVARIPWWHLTWSLGHWSFARRSDVGVGIFVSGALAGGGGGAGSSGTGLRGGWNASSHWRGRLASVLCGHGGLLLLLGVELVGIAVHGRIAGVAHWRHAALRGLSTAKSLSLTSLRSTRRRTAPAITGHTARTTLLLLTLRTAGRPAPRPRPPRRTRRSTHLRTRRLSVPVRRRHGRIPRIAHGRIARIPTSSCTRGPSLALGPSPGSCTSTRSVHAAVGAHGHRWIHVVIPAPLLLRRWTPPLPGRTRHAALINPGSHRIERTMQLSPALRQSPQRTPRRPPHLLDLIMLRNAIRIRRRQLRHGGDGVKIGLLPQIAGFLPGRRPTHVIDHVGISPQKVFVVVRTAIGSLATHPFEAPAVDLSYEALVSRLGKVLRTNLFHKVILIQHLPGTAVGHPGNGMMKVRIAEYVVQFHGEDRFGPRSRHVVGGARAGDAAAAVGIVDVVGVAVDAPQGARALRIDVGFLRRRSRGRLGDNGRLVVMMASARHYHHGGVYRRGSLS